MSNSSVGVAELFQLLESNKSSDVEETKQVFHDHFLSTKDNWLVNGLFDYYLSTNSLRAIEVLSGVREPHDKHLLDRMTESLARPNSHGQRVQTLTILGHIARRQPTWLYKLTNHSLFRELLKLLKIESDALSMMSALLLLVTLLPMLPAALGPYLNEIFEVFSRLASYHHVQSSNLSLSLTAANNLDKDQLYLLHFQLALYSLFHRLYAMYPCSMVAYLRMQYSQRDHDATFRNTIKPMLHSVRMHPLLITASKEAETSAARWKKMEHHDVVAECGRFALDRGRDEILVPINARATPLLDQTCPYTPVSVAEGLLGSGTSNGMEEDSFWSPSMAIPPLSPTSIQAPGHEPRSAPPTPNNIRSSSSPPEAAIEATPETTPVKDMRQISTRQPIASAAVRALGNFGNGSLSSNSRPSTPSIVNTHSSAFAGLAAGDSGIFGQKLNKLIADRQSFSLISQKSVYNIDGILENCFNQNGKNDSWNEDQEVLQIVNSQFDDDKTRRGRPDMPRRVRCLRFNSENFPSAPLPAITSFYKVSRSKSDSNLRAKKKQDVLENNLKASHAVTASTQTEELVPYENLLIGVLQQKNHEQRSNADSRLSPTSMVDRYIEACARMNPSNGENKLRLRKKVDDDGSAESTEDVILDPESSNQLLQLMQMQLLFETQRREVHAERNRRLLGKLRDSRALEEQNTALKDRLLMTTNELETLKSQLERCKKESRLADNRFSEALHHWQTKCMEEEKSHHILRDRTENLVLELKNEKKKVAEREQETRKSEAAFFDAAHQLKDALKAASRGEELKRVLDTVQKKFVLLGEIQTRLQERNFIPMPATRQETALMQRSYTEELSSLRRQLDARTSLGEALRSRLAELESREARKESQLVEQQRLLQEAKECHEAELRAVESKYKAQVEINLLLESKILQLHGNLEAATSRSTPVNLASSASPKERSPPLSGSLASSSEGSIAFHSGTGIMSDCCDSAGEIANLQAIVEPSPISSQTNTPSRLRKK